MDGASSQDCSGPLRALLSQPPLQLLQQLLLLPPLAVHDQLISPSAFD